MDNLFYANKVEVADGEHEIILDFHFKTGEHGRRSTVARVVLPPVVAAKLARLLPTIEPPPKAEPPAAPPVSGTCVTGIDLGAEDDCE
jgi:hypothetical protein